MHWLYLLYPNREDHRTTNVVNSLTIPHFATSPPLLFDAIRIVNFSADTFPPMVGDELLVQWWLWSLSFCFVRVYVCMFAINYSFAFPRSRCAYDALSKNYILWYIPVLLISVMLVLFVVVDIKNGGGRRRCCAMCNARERARAPRCQNGNPIVSLSLLLHLSSATVAETYRYSTDLQFYSIGYSKKGMGPVPRWCRSNQTSGVLQPSSPNVNRPPSKIY